MYQIIIWEQPEKSSMSRWQKRSAADWFSRVHLGSVMFLIIIPLMLAIALFVGLTAVH